MTSLYRSMLSFGVLLTIGCATLSDEELDLSCDGPIAESTTRSELVDRFGPANVTDEEIGVGEGETVDGTAIFPEDASRRIEIVWHDPDRKNRIASIRVQEPSVWRLGGLTTGLDLETTEQLNGRSFSLYGFEWDYAGTISSWNGGAFDAPGECRILARFNPTVDDHETGLAGEEVFGSDDPRMRGLDPRIYELLLIFD